MIKLTFCLRRLSSLTREDERRFIDLERSPLFFGEERLFVGG
jgi:hypothetical protein